MQIKKALKSVARLWLLALLIIIWQLVSENSSTISLQLPPPSEVFSGAVELIQKGTLQKDIYASLSRVFIAIGVALLVAIPLGSLLGASKSFSWSFEPVVNFFRPIPPLAWIPLSILWFGISNVQNEFIIFSLIIMLFEL